MSEHEQEQKSARAADTAHAVVMRKADGPSRGKMGGVEAAFGKLSGASGAPLPQPIQRKFEASLGADLSSVRVHTGAASADAASAVSAKAFATGQHIHFNAGQYNPGSAAGETLLAHEVAHTVQQSGGSPTTQYKLEVSQPGDAHEVEADRAAAAMVAGERTAVTSVGAGIHREEMKLEEDKIEASGDTSAAEEMRRAADSAAAERAKMKPPRITGMTTDVDVGRARSIITRIDGATGPLGEYQGAEQAINAEYGTDLSGNPRSGWVPHSDASRLIATNKTTREALQSFADSAQSQQFEHGFFSTSFRQLVIDRDRVMTVASMIESLNLKVAGEGASEDVRSARGENAVLNTKIEGLGTAIEGVKTAAANVPKAAQSATQSYRSLSVVLSGQQLPLPELEDTDAQAAAMKNVAAIKADLAAAKGAISRVQGIVTTAMTMYGGPAVMEEVGSLKSMALDAATDANNKMSGGAAAGVEAGAGAAADAAGGSIKAKLAGVMSNYTSRIAAADGKVAALKQQVKDAQLQWRKEAMVAAQQELAERLDAFFAACKAVEDAKVRARDLAADVQKEVENLKSKTDTKIGEAAQALVEVSGFVIQCDTTTTLGKREQEEAGKAKGHQENAAGSFQQGPGYNQFSGQNELAETAGGKTYYTCDIARGYTAGRALTDLSGFKVHESEVRFIIEESNVDRHSQVMGSAVDEQLTTIGGWRDEAAKLESKLKSALIVS